MHYKERSSKHSVHGIATQIHYGCKNREHRKQLFRLMQRCSWRHRHPKVTNSDGWRNKKKKSRSCRKEASKIASAKLPPLVGASILDYSWFELLLDAKMEMSVREGSNDIAWRTDIMDNVIETQLLYCILIASRS